MCYNINQTLWEASILADNSKLNLILALHNHQPVGNFDHVLEEAYKKAYLPFIKLLQRHPSIKVVLHYSGHLLSWMKEKHPEAIEALKEFVKHERAEFLSGGFYEPIISVLPEKDRIMQIKELTAYITGLLAYKPKGMWLAERVWEPQMPKYLSEAGIDYIPLDDYHFKLSGLDDKDLHGYFLTEDTGHSLKVFPGSERLRYYMPFHEVGESISYMKELYRKDGPQLITMADDGEKFGVWPKTHKHCYEDGWLERFFSAIEANSDWLETTTFSDYQARHIPVGTVYLPTASYREMGEWALPPEKGLEYERVLSELERVAGESAKGLLRGGIWRSFLSKYPESNHIHKRMLMISRKVHEAVEKTKGEGLKAKDRIQNPKSKIQNPQLMLHELWKGQCNDAYWHGIFGGLYLPHLRSALYRHLINAEAWAEEMLRQDSAGSMIEDGDLDCDGFRGICISNKDMTTFFSEQGGNLLEISLKRWSVNILDALTRRPEAYHMKISETAGNTSGAAKTIHESLEVKEEGLSDYLIYDMHRRTSLLDHFFDYNVSFDSVIRSDHDEKGDFIKGRYSMETSQKGKETCIKLARKGTVSGSALEVGKTVRLRDSKIDIDYLLEGSYSGLFAIEFNISLLGSPYASINLDGKNLYIKDSGRHDDTAGFSVTDDFLKLALTFSFDDNIALWHYPVETVSLSEGGIERIYQGTALLFVWQLDFRGHKSLGFKMRFTEAK